MLPRDLQSPVSRSPINYPKVLTVEGHDAFQFVKALLRVLGLLTSIELRNFGGNTDLAEHLDLLTVTSGFERVTSLGIIRDAETDAAQAFQSVSAALSQAGLPMPRQPMATSQGIPGVSVFLFPNCASPGALETLCLQSVSGDPALPCVDDYFRCVQQRGLTLPGNLVKAHVHAFLSSRARPHLLLGQAAHEGYWPWDNPAFDLLKQFLRAL